MLVTIRHGQTDYNKKRIFSGLGDEPRLTDEAIVQAFHSGEKLKDLGIEIAIVSPLTRAKQTFEEINKSINVEMHVDNRLIERDFKSYENTNIDLIDPKDYWDMDNCKKYDMETLEELADRVEKALNDVKEKYHDKNVLIVAHSGVCRAIKYIVEGKINKHWYEYHMDNLKAYIYQNW